jgi:hypothetical protein
MFLQANHNVKKKRTKQNTTDAFLISDISSRSLRQSLQEDPEEGTAVTEGDSFKCAAASLDLSMGQDVQVEGSVSDSPDPAQA